MIDKILKLREDGKSDTEIGKELDISRQKVAALVKKNEYAMSQVVKEDEFPAHMYANESDIIMDEGMGGSVIMTAREYNEYSEANGRYQGRKEGQKTALDPLEYRVLVNHAKSYGVGSSELREHIMNKHGLSEMELKKVIKRLTMEEEVSMREAMKPVGLK